MDADIEISVIMPTYNRAAVIGRAIESVLAQSFPPAELLIIDDGSTDATAAIVRRYRNEHCTLRYVRVANSGAAAARNEGLRRSKGDWIAFLDSDDWWSADKLSNAKQQMKLDPDAEFIHANKRYVYADGRNDGRRPFAPRDCADRKYLLCHWAMKTSTVLIRRSLLHRLGDYFPLDIETCEDYELFWRAVAAARSLRYAPECDTSITMTPGSLIRSGPPIQLLADDVRACGRAARWILEEGYDSEYARILRKFQYWQFRRLLAFHLRRFAVFQAVRAWTGCRRHIPPKAALRAMLSAMLAPQTGR